MKKLLNIDGGGVRVYLPLLILNYIEKKTQRKISDLFDYFAGVSSSSILISALLTHYTIDELLYIYKSLSKKIFNKSYYYTLSSGFGLFNSKYPDNNLNKELEEFFKDYRLCDVKKPLCILTYNLQDSKPLCFYSYKNHNTLPLWQVIRGSTSAPTYFLPYKIELNDDIEYNINTNNNNETNCNEHFDLINSNLDIPNFHINDSNIDPQDIKEIKTYNLIDGGMVSNNLSELTYINALSYFGNKEEFIQLSLGTGNYIHQYNTTPSGLWNWSSNIMDVLFTASSSYILKSMKKLSKFINLNNFHRIDIMLPHNILLDDYNAFDDMDDIFNDWLKDNKDMLDDICEKLVK